jgi:anaerobic ribonucleoside-triphosphate reductase activating protein
MVAEAPSTAPAPIGPQAMPAPVHAAGLRVGGLTPFTSIDYPGKLAAVVFVQGCPWRCSYCHNPHLQSRRAPPARAWSDLRDWLRGRRGLIDAVVFSGGEPTVDPGLPQAMTDTKRLGFAVGLHTAGIHPRRMREVLALVDWVGFDVKAPLAHPQLHEAIVGVRGASAAVERSLSLALASGAELECRTTAHPAFLDEPELLQIGRDLHARGVRRYAVQVARCVKDGDSPATFEAAPAGYPGPATLESLRQMFPSFVLRREGDAAFGA